MAKGAVAEKKGVEIEETVSLLEDLRSLIGEKVGLICARYHYWGIVAGIVENDNFPFVKLANAVSVEQSGPSRADHPQETDPIGSTIRISIGAIEMIHQCNWTRASLPGEKD